VGVIQPSEPADKLQWRAEPQASCAISHFPPSSHALIGGSAVRKPTLPAAKKPPPADAQTPAPDEPIPFDEDGLKRVGSIIKNARATWFALLGALVFASITLASVKDVSFFVNTVETKLPVVGISVPVTSFFWAGSLLIAAIYAYFHLYLELLWQALGDAPARIGGKPLADRIDPWIVADSALRLRGRLRGAHCDARASRKRAIRDSRHNVVEKSAIHRIARHEYNRCAGRAGLLTCRYE
jgi:hypothetical protein